MKAGGNMFSHNGCGGIFLANDISARFFAVTCID